MTPSRPTSVGTLGAIHEASALFARDRYPGLIMATHDVEPAVAARAGGFEAPGVAGRLR